MLYNEKNFGYFNAGFIIRYAQNTRERLQIILGCLKMKKIEMTIVTVLLFLSVTAASACAATKGRIGPGFVKKDKIIDGKKIYIHDYHPLQSLVELRPDDITTIMFWRGQAKGKLTSQYTSEPWFDRDYSLYGFLNENDVITWTVRAPEDADYAIAVIYGGIREVLLNCQFELYTDNTRLTAKTRPVKQPEGQGKLQFRRHWVHGTLPLKKGKNRISLHLINPGNVQIETARKDLAQEVIRFPKWPDSFRIYSIELARPEALAAIKQRAKRLRSSTDWMAEGKYGLFVHYSPLIWPLYGNTRACDNWQWGVELFDVEAFADAVEQTGAAWVLFTVNHRLSYYPFPSKVIDRILPGRTCKRDLIMEIADALAKKNIRLTLYFQYGRDDTQWHKAVGMMDRDPTRWFENEIAIATQISQRYGRKVSGVGTYIDRGTTSYYQFDFPWERFVRALKSGNPDGVVGISNNSYPRVSWFSDLAAQDSGKAFNPAPPKEWFAEGGPYEGLRATWFINLDAWVPREPYNGIIRPNSSSKGGPQHKTAKYVEYFRKMAEANVPITVNMLITQDVTREQPFFHPDCLEVMRQVRKAIRGK